MNQRFEPSPRRPFRGSSRLGIRARSVAALTVAAFSGAALSTGAVAVASAFLPFGLTSCSSSSTAPVPISPITGVVVRSQFLLGALRCGLDDDQVQKYAILIRHKPIVPGVPGVPVAYALYDCFSDAYFLELTPSETGSLDFDLDVKAMNAVSYKEQASDIANGGQAMSTFDGIAGTWSTTCTATQQADIKVLAVCDPLERSMAPGGVRLVVNDFPGGDSSTVSCPASFLSAFVTVTGPNADTATVSGGSLPDAGVPDAGNPDAGAPDSGAPDSGNPDGGDAGLRADEPSLATLPTVPPLAPATSGSLPALCGATVTVPTSNVGDVYTFDVQLVAGGTVGHTQCTATVQPGVNVRATCSEVVPTSP